MYHITYDYDPNYVPAPAPPKLTFLCICITNGTVYAHHDPDAAAAMQGLVDAITVGEWRPVAPWIDRSLFGDQVLATVVGEWLLRSSWGGRGRCALFAVDCEDLDPLDRSEVNDFVRAICEKDRTAPPAVSSLRILGNIQPQ
tara:strand:- start:152 stop:577 length:426 start_codon:yes stop_codon:yes gene_type:complete